MESLGGAPLSLGVYCLMNKERQADLAAAQDQGPVFPCLGLCPAQSQTNWLCVIRDSSCAPGADGRCVLLPAHSSCLLRRL